MNPMRFDFQWLVRIFAAGFLFAITFSSQAKIIRVPKDYPSIQWAAGVAAPGDEVWVNGGTYHSSVMLTNSGVAIYGGFAGTETKREQRDPKAHPTIIDGQHIIPRMVIMQNLKNTRLDGFTITGGFSTDWPPYEQYGAGINCLNVEASNVIANCTITGNIAHGGGGMYLDKSSPRIENCDITTNTAGDGGGIFLANDSSTVISKCNISGNRAYDDNAYSSGDGGGILATTSSPQIENCILAGNTSEGYGGGIYSLSDMKILNCTIANNTSPAGGGIFKWEGDEIEIRNTIFSNNDYLAIYNFRSSFTEMQIISCLFYRNSGGDYRDSLVSYNGQQMNLFYSGFRDNVFLDPKFTSATDFHLRNGSDAIDHADLSSYPATDIEGNPRPGSDGKVDIGAYEAPENYQWTQPDRTAPVSLIYRIPETRPGNLVTTNTFGVEYIADDMQSRVRDVKLYYRRNHTTWTQYGSTFKENPIVFHAAPIGDGIYEFYTQATDNAGNSEPPPRNAKAKMLVIWSYSGSRIYVDAKAWWSAGKPGTSWGTALNEINTAVWMGKYFNVHEIWVAHGCYREWINMPDSARIYGGFAGNETSLAQRDWNKNATVVAPPAGRIFSPGVVVFSDKIKNARLDGISATSATMINCNGIYCENCDNTNVIANCSIYNNKESGIEISGADPLITHCRIFGNSGGGIVIYDPSYGQIGSNAKIDSCIVTGNSGGGIYSDYCSPHIVNCLINRNAGYNTGGIYASDGALRIINCTISGNFGKNAGGIQLDEDQGSIIQNTILEGNQNYGVYESEGQKARLVSSLFFGNTKGDYSNEGAPALSAAQINKTLAGSAFNLDGDPKFLNKAAGDYRLGKGSMALGRGYLAGAPMIDIAGNPRPGTDGKVDIGAYEGLSKNAARYWAFYE